jgi:hypothetical protein
MKAMKSAASVDRLTAGGNRKWNILFDTLPDIFPEIRNKPDLTHKIYDFNNNPNKNVSFDNLYNILRYTGSPIDPTNMIISYPDGDKKVYIDQIDQPLQVE